MRAQRRLALSAGSRVCDVSPWRLGHLKLRQDKGLAGLQDLCARKNRLASMAFDLLFARIWKLPRRDGQER
jgi:hypothetical protein